jgi:hypothetical protein
MLKYKIKKDQLEKLKNNPSQLELTCQTHDPNYKIGIWKQIKINYEVKFSINPMLTDEN